MLPLLTLAWKPAQRRKKPASTPWALRVSIIEMPVMVEVDRLAWSRIMTREELMRLAEMTRAQRTSMPIETRPTHASSGEYWNIITR